MRAVVQRVKDSFVLVEGRKVGKIGRGLLVFLGISSLDREKDVFYICKKILNLRIFEDSFGKMNLCLKDVKGEVLAVSQFTLYADVTKGRRPSFTQAAKGDFAKNLYDRFIEEMGKEAVVRQGIFGSKMEVFLVNDGPATFIVES